MRTAYLKLRANIELDGDVLIAEREVKFFCEQFLSVKRHKVSEAMKHFNLAEENYLSNARKNEVISFIGFIKDRNRVRRQSVLSALKRRLLLLRSFISGGRIFDLF